MAVRVRSYLSYFVTFRDLCQKCDAYSNMVLLAPSLLSRSAQRHIVVPSLDGVDVCEDSQPVMQVLG